MFSENPADPVRDENPAGDNISLPAYGRRTVLIPALICAGISVILMRTGFLAFFLLVPLGFCAVVSGSAAAWLGFCFAAAGNAVFAAGSALVMQSRGLGTGLAGAGLDIFYFTVLALGFTWIMAGNPVSKNPDFPVFPLVRTVFRFIGASILGALTLIGMIYMLDRDGTFSAFIRSTAELISSVYVNSADAAQQSILKHLLSPDKITDALKKTALNGGVLASVFFLFFFSRQAAFLAARLSRRYHKTAGDLIGFYAPGKTIWLLTICLPVILLCRVVSIKIVEVAAWNLLIICAVIFLAQGGGIIIFTLARRPIPGFIRLLGTVMFIILIFSPGINAAAVGLIILLGIAENWLPLRRIGKPKEEN